MHLTLKNIPNMLSVSGKGILKKPFYEKYASHGAGLNVVINKHAIKLLLLIC